MVALSQASTFAADKRMNPILKAKRGFGQGIPNWLKLSNIVQQGPSTLNTN